VSEDTSTVIGTEGMGGNAVWAWLW